MASVFVSLNSAAFSEMCTQYNITFDPSVFDEIRKIKEPHVMVINYEDCNNMDKIINIEEKAPYLISAAPTTVIRIGNTYGGRDVAEIFVPMVSADSASIEVYCRWTIHDMPSMQCYPTPPALPVTPPVAPIHKKTS